MPFNLNLTFSCAVVACASLELDSMARCGITPAGVTGFGVRDFATCSGMTEPGSTSANALAAASNMVIEIPTCLSAALQFIKTSLVDVRSVVGDYSANSS